MRHKRVAVLRGGPSEEYSVSMLTGAGVLKALAQMGYPYKDIVITKKGEWLENGIVKRPEHALHAVDVVFIALHGSFGEDGSVQRFLQQHKIPFTGSNALTSSIAFNKHATKDRLQSAGVKMAEHYKLSQSEISRLDIVVRDLNTALGEELFVKPISGGSSIGASYAPNPETLRASLETLLKQYDEVMVEQFIRGKEATVAVLEGFRGQSLYVLPVIEIVPPAGEPLFSFENKYNGKTLEICPGRFSYHEKAQLEEAARLVHESLHCDNYSRSDFIVKNGEIFFLEVNTLPGLTDESLFPKAAQSVGLSYTDLIEHLIHIARF